MERLRVFQYAASSGTSKRERDIVTSDEPLQHSMKRLRVDAPSTAFENPYVTQNLNVHQERNYQAPYPLSWKHQDIVTSNDLRLYDNFNQEQHHQQQQQKQQEMCQYKYSRCSSQTYIPINRLLGNLHQDRRLQQQRHDKQRNSTQLPSNSQLF